MSTSFHIKFLMPNTMISIYSPFEQDILNKYLGRIMNYKLFYDTEDCSRS